MNTPSQRNREEIVSALTGGYFSDRSGRVGGKALAQWLDAVLDVLRWKAVARRDSASRALMGLAERGDEDAHSELLRLLSDGPPHVRVSLVRALPDEIAYPVLASAWKGSQKNLWRGSARVEKLQRRVAIALACGTCIALILNQHSTFPDLEVKSRSNILAMFVAIAATCGVMPHLTAWIRFPARASWRAEYYSRLSELIRLDTLRERPQCLVLLPEVQAMSELVHGEVNLLGRELRETAAMIQAAGEQRCRFPIPADARLADSATLPIPAVDSPTVVN